MATVALLLCSTLVVVLLLVERRGSRGVSAALWIPNIWLMILASRPLINWFGNTPLLIRGTYEGDSGNALDRWALICLGLVGIAVLVRRRVDWAGLLRRHAWFLLLLAYMCLSTFWSAITLIALKRWAREWVAIVMALLVTTDINPLRTLSSLFRRTAYVLLPFSILLIKYYPAIGRKYGRYSGAEMWTGVTGQKNELGRLCMISVFFLVMELYLRWKGRPMAGSRWQRWADVSMIVLGFYLLIGSQSATSLATLLVGAVVFLGLRWLKKLKLRVPQTGLLALIVFLIAYGTSVPFLGGTNLAFFTSALGRDSTLTGRTEIWASVLPDRAQKPLLGYGFGSFWTDARRQAYDIPTSHNGYLDILLEMGEAGLLFYTIWLLSCARQLRRYLPEDYDWGSFAICLLCMGLIYNATESALNSLNDYMTAVMLVTVFAVLYHAMQERKRARRETAPPAEPAAEWEEFVAPTPATPW